MVDVFYKEAFYGLFGGRIFFQNILEPTLFSKYYLAADAAK